MSRRRTDARAAHETLAYRNDPPTQRAAAVAVAARSLDADEAAELLAMLGLLWPSDGSESVQGGPADLALGELRERAAQRLSAPGVADLDDVLREAGIDPTTLDEDTP